MERSNPPAAALRKEKSLKPPDLIDYSVYEFKPKEKAGYIALAAGIVITAAILCYDSIFYAVLLCPFVPVFIKKKRKTLIEERKWKLNLQFGECIECIASSLETGYSVENAISEAYGDMKLSFGEDEPIMREMETIIRTVMNSISVEEAFSALAKRSGVEDIRSFSDIFSTAKRTGGNIIRIIRTTSNIIHTRVEMKREIRTIISGKKLEADIMKAVPVFMLAYLKIFSPDLVDNLYGNLFGVIFMTVLLGVYFLLCRVSDRIVSFVL